MSQIERYIIGQHFMIAKSHGRFILPIAQKVVFPSGEISGEGDGRGYVSEDGRIFRSIDGDTYPDEDTANLAIKKLFYGFVERKEKFLKVCEGCGSEQVSCDGSARWSVQDQDWELVMLYDKASYCDDCDGETNIVSKKVP